MPQVAQWPLAQPAQALPALIARREPSAVLEKETKVEIARAAPGCPDGQVAGSSDRLMGRSSSNRC